MGVISFYEEEQVSIAAIVHVAVAVMTQLWQTQGGNAADQEN